MIPCDLFRHPCYFTHLFPLFILTSLLSPEKSPFSPYHITVSHYSFYSSIFSPSPSQKCPTSIYRIRSLELCYFPLCCSWTLFLAPFYFPGFCRYYRLYTHTWRFEAMSPHERKHKACVRLGLEYFTQYDFFLVLSLYLQSSCFIFLYS